jgi:hypothetical protein
MFFLYYSVHSATVYFLFDICLPAVKDVIFSQGCSQYTVIYFVELYITPESIFSCRYSHCFFILFNLFFFCVGGSRSVGTLYTYSLHLFSPVLHFLSVMWRSSDYGAAGVHLTENIYPLHVTDILVDNCFSSGAVHAVCSWSAPFLWTIEGAAQLIWWLQFLFSVNHFVLLIQTSSIYV